MANQAIALGVRGPQVPDLSRNISQTAQMINMMAQQRAAERQAAQAQQKMDIEARLAEPQFAKAQSEAQGASIKAAMEFNNFVRTGLTYAANPQQATEMAQKIGSLPQFQAPEFQQALAAAVQNMPQDPSQFGQYREGLLMSIMDADKQLERSFQRQTTGREERIISMPKYGMGAAVEVPGSRIEAAEDITYVRGPNGEIIPMPKTVPGTGGVGGTPGLVTGTRGGGGSAAAALQTNPGALKDGPFARSQPGYAGSSGGFATFNTPQAGIAAQENLLRSAYIGKGFNTIDKIVNRYAPPGPENSAASVSNYKKYIAQRTGLDINAPISPAQVPAVAAAMREFETGNRPGGKQGGGIQMGQPIPGTGKGEKISSEAYTAMEAAVAKYDDTIARAKRLLRNPALDSIVGNVQGNIPETVLSLSSQNAANALSDYNELLAVAGFQELQAMRDASPTGGALGQVSDSENKLLQQSAFASSRTQDEAKFRASLRNYIKRLEDSKRRVEGAYERTFGNRFTSQRGAPASAPVPAARPAAGKRLRFNPATGDFE